MSSLSQQKCVPTSKDTILLVAEEIEKKVATLGGHWKAINEHHLEKEYPFKDFKEALAFTNEISKVAEEENHHPDIHLSYGKVRVILWTHVANGLTENDFIMAAKIDFLHNLSLDNK